VALIVEDGTGVANANSFVTRAQIISYAAARGVTIADEDASDVFAIKAMDYLAIRQWCGVPAFVDQTTPWPRKGIVEGDTADDYEYTIPANIVAAQLQLALESKNGIDLLPSRSANAQVKREKVGPLETEYFGPAAYSPDLPFVAALIAPFECGQGFKLRTYRV
jgi:hypothetical protein